MITEEDKDEIRSIVLHELLQVLSPHRLKEAGSGIYDGSIDKATPVAEAISRAVTYRLGELQKEKDQRK